jgi:hypothetical protein
VGLLDDLLGDALGNLFTGGRTDKKLQRLAEAGELVPATIYAIRVIHKSDAADQWYYGLDMVTRGGPLRATVRQQLIPDPWRAPLGAHVRARHLDGRVAIDWPATLDEAGVEHQATLIAGKTLKKPLEPGIHDNNLDKRRLRDGTPAEAEVVASEPVVVMGMATENRRLELRVDDGAGSRTVVLKRELIPPYADLLARVGGRLPVAIDPKRPDRVTIDWATAAERAAGSAVVRNPADT